MKRHNLKNKRTKGKTIFEVVDKIGLKDFKIHLRTDKLISSQGIISLTDDPTKGTHFVAFKDHYYFESFCTEPSTEISNQLAECLPQNFCGCYISSNSIQNINDANCSSYCLFFRFLMQENSFLKTIIRILIDRYICKSYF